jgi:hypothetical protein
MCVTKTGYLAMGIKGQTMGCTVLFTEDRPDVSIPALEYASFGSVPYNDYPEHSEGVFTKVL